jgi:hypothetical protein
VRCRAVSRDPRVDLPTRNAQPRARGAYTWLELTIAGKQVLDDALAFSGEVPLVVIEASTAFVIVVARIRSVPAAQGSHLHCGSHPGDQVSDLYLPCSRALLNRNQPTGMNRYRTDSDFERQC